MAEPVVAQTPIAHDHDAKEKPSRPKKANNNRGKRLAELHFHRLPLNTKPLPTFIPNNPLSIIHILWAIVSEYMTPYSSHPTQKYTCSFSPSTRSVHVTDAATIRALWEKGFFGKGNLSRSEPNWLEAEQKRVGLKGGQTAEEWTRKRRQERIAMKMERARLEQEIIEEQRKKESRLLDEAERAAAANRLLTPPASDDDEPSSAAATAEQWNPARIPLDYLEEPVQLSRTADEPVADEPQNVQPNTDSASTEHAAISEDALAADKMAAIAAAESATVEKYIQDENVQEDAPPKKVVNQEHLQLTLEEAFFLAYSMNVLNIEYPSHITPPTTNGNLLHLFRRHSAFPPTPTGALLQPDDAFMLHYVVYHHFRSLGWVVRDGIKFAIDYLLYERGPAFKHAEFAVQIVPSYSHPYWSETEERRTKVDQDRRARSWHWFHCINRVQTQVTKTMVLVYVDVPPPSEGDGALEGDIDIGALLRRYKIREFAFKRWSANRNRG